ncbi:hypothetical protein G6F57_020886 [Rhizopus arrhizus]|nr:hypothetical protein G6F57_020886 [Rhizopus arrhizus]
MGVAGAAPAPGRRRGNVSTGATAVDPGPIRACAPFRQRIPASARGLVRPHRGAEVGPGHRAAAVGAATRRPSGLCPGFGGELAERCQQGPACMGARRVCAVAGRQARRRDRTHLQARVAFDRGVAASMSELAHPAVHDDLGAHDEGGLRRGQVQHGGRQFLRRPRRPGPACRRWG